MSLFNGVGGGLSDRKRFVAGEFEDMGDASFEGFIVFTRVPVDWGKVTGEDDTLRDDPDEPTLPGILDWPPINSLEENRPGETFLGG